MTRLVRIVFFLGSVLMLEHSSFATNYYVDYSAGNDKNPGTSKTYAWRDAPGMPTCTGQCSSAKLNAGDSIILRGGVTWPNSSFMWNLPGNGTSSKPIYVGVDKTWYSGSTWTRPVLTAGGAPISNNYDTMFNVPANVTIDNFEITGFYWTAAACAGAPYGDCGIFNAGQRNGQTWENLYIHGWKHAGTDAATNNGIADIISTGGGGNSVAHDNLIVGTDVPGDHSVSVFFNGPPIAYNNYIKQVSSAFIVSYATSVHDNHIEDIGPAYCNTPFPQYAGTCTHENGFEDNGDSGLDFYNNVITNVNGGLALWLAPNPGYSVTAWNNVIYAIHDNQVLDMAPPVYNPSLCNSGATANDYCNTAGNYIFENNTVECGDDSTQYDQCQSNVGNIGSGSTASSFIYQNNHFITATSSSGCATGSGAPRSCTFSSSNVVQTLAAANGQGYNSSQSYAFSPTSAQDSTVVMAGANLTSSATGGLASLVSDTTYACADAGGSQSQCPTRTTLSRPATGAWNTGAYEYSTSSISSARPTPPTGLTGVIR